MQHTNNCVTLNPETQLHIQPLIFVDSTGSSTQACLSLNSLMKLQHANRGNNYIYSIYIFKLIKYSHHFVIVYIYREYMFTAYYAAPRWQWNQWYIIIIQNAWKTSTYGLTCFWVTKLLWCKGQVPLFSPGGSTLTVCKVKKWAELLIHPIHPVHIRNRSNVLIFSPFYHACSGS